MGVKVFVYGTLMSSEPANSVLKRAGAAFVGKTSTTPEYTLLNLGAYPGVILGGMTEVHGEVWEVPLHQLSRLDYYEGYPHLYTRKVIPTGLGDATIYLYNGEVEPGTYEVIRDGRW